MLRTRLLIATAVLAALVSTTAWPQVPIQAPPNPTPPLTLGTGAAKPLEKPLEQTPRRLPGYLGPHSVPDAIAILPPPPAPGSKAEALDQAIYLQTRKLESSPRWALAAQDAVETPTALEGDFSCAMGVRLEPGATPAFLRLMSRMGADAGALVNQVKDHYHRPRPFVHDALPICVKRTEALAKSPSYPSGHTTFGWATGLILAEIEPDRASQILARARAFGESRAVCGVHYASDVEEGRTTGAALVAALHANAEFRADVEAARKELIAFRADSPALGGSECAVSDAAAAHTPWSQ